MDTSKLNSQGQVVMAAGFRKAIVTRINGRRWAYRTGWASQAELREGGEARTKWEAVLRARAWLND